MSSREQRRAIVVAVQRIALGFLLRRGVVSADDIRKEIILPAGIDPRIVGPAFLAMKNRGWIEEIGDHRTARPIAHRRAVRDWKLKVAPQVAASLIADPQKFDTVQSKHRTLFD